MEGGRFDSWCKLGKQIQSFDNQNMIFFRNVLNENWSKVAFWGTWIFSIFFISYFLEKRTFKEAEVKPDLPHIDKG